ncbi:MAG: TlpA disulfide reductase family protein [Ardenticatenia bacterium]|nr:TlpA disulfide reductase family protein [Ardenticatenia bacterium]
MRSTLRSRPVFWSLLGCSLVLCAGTVLVGALGLWVWSQVVSPAPPTPFRQPVTQPGGAQHVPPLDFSATDVEGRTWRLADLRGSPVVLTFWVTWCLPCQAELADLQRLAAAYEDQGLVVLLVNVEEPALIVSDYLETEEITLPSLLDQGDLVDQFRIRTLPTTVLIRPDGTLGGRVLGRRGAAYLERSIESILVPLD